MQIFYGYVSLLEGTNNSGKQLSTTKTSNPTLLGVRSLLSFLGHLLRLNASLSRILPSTLGIIPVSKWLIAMDVMDTVAIVSKSPKWGWSSYKWRM